jgi:hypothetical protein
MKWLALLFVLGTGCTAVCSNNRTSCPVNGATPAFQDPHYCYSDSDCGVAGKCEPGGQCVSSDRE